ncbi:hypothetical protein Syn7502_00011 [Synechococcus sp. PCC 7502]|uniref:hypothetical protein n=1 Tax=Synechococcus sp. PCC 7502 TaxID=1173263 RepID=UPI00029FAA0B|nr:hypothetical protein [Synechococcus sp. PCC 7502]AFY72186.1 hypothetical protein Syn7502_00011 [Synechococcus sp. PCC 7502]
MDELKPILQELTLQPTAFLGGLVAGFLRLDLNEDPLKTWLSQQGVATKSTTTPKQSGPQSISID